SYYTLLDVVKAVLFLVSHPNIESPNSYFGYLENGVLLAKNTIHVLAGLPVHLQRFAPKLSWYEWAEANGILSLYEEDDYGSEGCVSSDWVDVSQVIRVEDVQKFDDKQDSEFYGFASLCRVSSEWWWFILIKNWARSAVSI
uniref:DNA-directed RNA polymerase n=1 Tax=Mesocestoides corti TaxID=53468 RepID=A0A5K3G3P6_MESCO